MIATTYVRIVVMYLHTMELLMTIQHAQWTMSSVYSLKGNHDLARYPTLVAEKVGQHLTKCMDYKSNEQVIDFTISIHYRNKFQMVQL